MLLTLILPPDMRKKLFKIEFFKGQERKYFLDTSFFFGHNGFNYQLTNTCNEK